jgi:hypothetical protein
MRPLGTKQIRILLRVADKNPGWAQSWLWATDAERQRLVDLGLILNPDAPRHRVTTEYELTELGQQVVCGHHFSAGLEIGYLNYAAAVGYRLEKELQEAKEQAQAEYTTQLSFDTRGQTYGDSGRLDTAVRDLLWKNVKVEP